MDAEGEIRALLEQRVQAVAAKDAATLLATYDAAVRTFPVLPPAETRGPDAIAEGLRQWVDGYTEGPTYRIENVSVDVDGTLAYCAFRYHVGGTLASGQAVDMWVRATLALRRVDGRWTIVHAHESVPFDPESGRALVDLGPDGG
jgi:uncharacterized protein (TIGR02246 family)